MDIKTLFLILHIFGAVIGAGSAFFSDLLFLKSVRDGIISKTEIGFLRLGSMAVWIGLLLLLVSGAGLFFLDVDKYLTSNKFLAKMTVVAILITNGILFHTVHLSRIVRHADQHFPSSDEFMRKSSLLLISGAISVVSWSTAITLGVMKNVPYSYGTIMFWYALALGGAIISALLLKRKLLP